MGRFDTQDDNETAWTGVDSSENHRDTGTPVASEFIIEQKSDDGIHIHKGHDENGEELFHAEREKS